ncbi:S8 family serine peptidase [Nocardia sp. SYP-A9097]|uniref:S8 family serine peptidase n=1 Tax=Nocardia sp. SYP-A9097 TaxID=2663237 RepID=UPI00129A9940|nr:S8 family serine peptidase [Nocardia sp. SYP-A9097]MRH90519.1 S8 family serine peptidase [Nocardia sp. SYP-A9097]
MRVLIQVRPTVDLVAAVADPAVHVTAAEVLGGLPDVVIDHTYTPVAVPGYRQDSAVPYSMAPEHATVLVRGEIADEDLATVVPRLTESAAITGIFADPVVEGVLTCGDTGPVGTSRDVGTLLHTTEFATAGLTGAAVALAIVDTGINAAFVEKIHGGSVNIDAQRSWNPPGVTGKPGQFPVDHGSMCAFDALIAAPQASLLDFPVLRSTRHGGTTMDGLLSDALAGYAQLRTVLTDQPAATRALVVSNSWGSFSSQWDFPVGNPGNYSDNPSHPFNVIVGSLESAGADILFAAGNCGRDCPDGRCAYKDKPIGGANSHASVLSIGGVDTTNTRVGYSSQGPGRLTARKPDVCTYTHFLGSTAFGAGTPDTGTSAATPVAAGLVAAIRTHWPATTVSPAQLRDMLRRNTIRRGTTDFDYDYGYGVIDSAGVLTELREIEVRA